MYMECEGCDKKFYYPDDEDNTAHCDGSLYTSIFSGKSLCSDCLNNEKGYGEEKENARPK